MGRGDKRTKRGKISMGTFGRRRTARTRKNNTAATSSTEKKA